MKSFLIITFSILIYTLSWGVETEDNLSTNTVILDEYGVRNLRIATVEVEEKDFESTVFAVGRIEEIPSTRAVLSTRIAGRVVELNAFEGDTVEKGQILVRVESRQMGDPPPVIELRAPQSGLVVVSHVRMGQPVEPNAELMDISDQSQMWAVARIPEKEAALIEKGSIAHLKIPALGDQVIEASLYRFGIDADRSTGTIEGIFLIENTSKRLRPGMRTEFNIVIRKRARVMAVPRDAIQGDPANRVVFVKDFEIPNAFIKVPVILGEQNNTFVEITRGLFPGDEVVTRGSYSLSFVGGGSGMSLKDALDAAHGHEHNEDGSKISEEQLAKEDDSSVHSDEYARLNPWLLLYAGIVTTLLLIISQLYWRKRHSPNA